MSQAKKITSKIFWKPKTVKFLSLVRFDFYISYYGFLVTFLCSSLVLGSYIWPVVLSVRFFWTWEKEERERCQLILFLTLAVKGSMGLLVQMISKETSYIGLKMNNFSSSLNSKKSQFLILSFGLKIF